MNSRVVYKMWTRCACCMGNNMPVQAAGNNRRHKLKFVQTITTWWETESEETHLSSQMKPLIFEVLTACGTSVGMVHSQSRGPEQEPEPPVCHFRQNPQQHEEILLLSSGTLLTVFRQLLKSLFPAITHPASSFLLHPAPPGAPKEDAETERRSSKHKIRMHTQILSWDGARISNECVNKCQERFFKISFKLSARKVACHFLCFRKRKSCNMSRTSKAAEMCFFPTAIQDNISSVRLTEILGEPFSF